MINIKTIGLFLSSMLLGCSSITTQQCKTFTIEGKEFDQDVVVVVDTNIVVACNYIKNNFYKDITLADFEARGVTFPTEDGKPVVIWLPNTEDIGVNNHELMHATISIMNWAGIELSDETEEAFGYEMQYLSKEFYKNIDNARRIN